MNKKIILIAGPPASGKTFVAKQIANLLETAVYLDKDDLSPLIRRVFDLHNEALNMDGDFYVKNLRDVEYESIVKIAFSALEFNDFVILNAPFGPEVRDTAYMRTLKEKAGKLRAKLILIWVNVTKDICCERMKKRGSDRDTKKLQNWNAYIKNICFDPPTALQESHTVDRLIVFDVTTDDKSNQSLNRTLEILKNEEE